MALLWCPGGKKLLLKFAQDNAADELSPDELLNALDIYSSAGATAASGTAEAGGVSGDTAVSGVVSDDTAVPGGMSDDKSTPVDPISEGKATPVES